MIEQEGDTGQAIRRYLAALDQLTALQQVTAPATRPAATPLEMSWQDSAAQAGVDPLVLRRDLETAVARLRSSAD